MILTQLVMLMIVQAVRHTTFSTRLQLDGCTGVIKSCEKICSDFFIHVEEMSCSCDPQCRYVFADCCADYRIQCSRSFAPEDITHNHFRWGCRKIFPDPKTNKSFYIVDKCMHGWPNDEISRNCSTRNARSFHDILLVVPVLDPDKVLFRNAYCAFCNGLKPKDMNFWKVKFPEKTKFNHSKALIVLKDFILYDPSILDKDVNISDMRLSDNKLGIRICQDFIASCRYTQDRVLVDGCKNGPAAIISDGKRNFKNYECLACNYQNKSGIPSSLMCGPQYKNVLKTIWEPASRLKYSLIFGAELYSRFTTKRVCPEGYLFDKKNRRCLKTYQFPHFSSLQAPRAFYISVEYKGKITNTSECKALNSSNEKSVFVNTFKKILHNRTDKNIHVSSLKVISGQNSYLVAFRIVNTIQQQVRNLSNTNATYTQRTTPQLNDFTSSFKTQIDTKMCQYIPKGVRSREMICVENRTFPIDIKDIEDKTTIFLEETQMSYSQGEFWVFDKENSTVVVVCEHFMPTNCPHYINATDTSDWFLFSNLSLLYNVTGEIFEYGDYSIKNNTAWLCLSEKTLLNQPTKRVEITSIHDKILPTLSIVVNVVSITSLIALITIYTLFPSLRNLPGKNLMLMCTALAIAQLLWLLQDQISSIFSRRCDIILIALHYFFLASFTSSGSIAYHSNRTFYSISKGRLQGTESRFVWYILYSLGCPLITVALFWLIDFYNVLEFGYGKSDSICWFGKRHGMYIAFAGPIYLQLLVNVVLLLVTLKWIYKCSKANLALSEKNDGVRKQDIGIYLRMSTLMGLTWIFGVLLLTFPGVLVFDYLFNIVNGLQGFYIAMAFLSTKSVGKLLGCKAKTQRKRSTISQ